MDNSSSKKEESQSQNEVRADFRPERIIKKSIPYRFVVENATDLLQPITLFGNYLQMPEHDTGVNIYGPTADIKYKEMVCQFNASPFQAGMIYISVIKGDVGKIERYCSVMRYSYKEANGDGATRMFHLVRDPYQSQERVWIHEEEFWVDARATLDFRIPPESTIMILVYPFFDFKMERTMRGIPAIIEYGTNVTKLIVTENKKTEEPALSPIPDFNKIDIDLSVCRDWNYMADLYQNYIIGSNILPFNKWMEMYKEHVDRLEKTEELKKPKKEVIRKKPVSKKRVIKKKANQKPVKKAAKKKK